MAYYSAKYDEGRYDQSFYETMFCSKEAESRIKKNLIKINSADYIDNITNSYNFDDYLANGITDNTGSNNGLFRSSTYQVDEKINYALGKIRNGLKFPGSVFPVDERSGTDIIPFGKSGTLANGTVTGATLTTDRFGATDSAYSFDGSSNQYITGGSGVVPTNVTISIWVKAEGTQISENIYPASYSGKFGFLGPGGGTSRRVGIITRNAANSDYVYYQWTSETSANPYDGNWHMYTIAMDNTYLYCWVDGVSCGSPKAHSDNIDLVNSTNFLIGTWTTSYGHHTGKIDDVHIFNRALTSTEVLALYNAEVSATTQRLDDAHYYPFNGNANDEAKIITKVAQSFVAPANGTIHLIGFKRASNTGTNADYQYMEIWSDSGGSPNAKVGSFSWGWSTSNWSAWSSTTDNYIRTQLINAGLTPGTTYWLVWRKNTNSDTNYPNLYYDSANDYGVLKTYDGSTWNTQTGSLRFALGYTDWVALDSYVSLPPTSFSVSWWMKTTSTAYECLFSANIIQSSGQIEIATGAVGIRYESYTNNAFSRNNMSTGITISDGEWHHYVITSGTSAFKLYVDGVNSYSTTANTDTANQRFQYFGALQSAPNGTYGRGFSGSLDDVRFYNSELTKDQISLIYLREPYGNARLMINYIKNKNGNARLENTYTKNKTATARLKIVNNYTKDKTATARIELNSTKQRSGKARLTSEFLSPYQGDTRIEINYLKQKYGEANVTTSKFVNKTGITRVIVNFENNKNGNSRIQVNSNLKQKNGTARIIVTNSKNKNGLSRVIVNKSKNKNATARLIVPFEKIVTGNSRLQKALTKNKNSNARINTHYYKQKNGVARILFSSTKEKNGIANLELTTIIIKEGTARLYKLYNKQISGNVRLLLEKTKGKNSNARIKIFGKTKSKSGNANVYLLEDISNLISTETIKPVLTTGNVVPVVSTKGDEFWVM